MFCEAYDVCLHVLYTIKYWVKVFVFVVGAYSIDVGEVDAEIVFGFCGGDVSDKFVVVWVCGEGGLGCGSLVGVVGEVLW